MKVEIISPEGEKLSCEAISVMLPGSKGAFEILKHHAPIVSTLGKGKIVIKSDKKFSHENIHTDFEHIKENEIALEVSEGTIEFKNEHLIILAS